MATIHPSAHTLKNGAPVTLRTGLPMDTIPLLHTIRTYIAENEGMSYEPDEFKRTEAEQAQWIQGMLENPREILIVAEADGQLIGNIDFHIGVRRRHVHAGEFGMGMLKEWRSQGLGALLMTRMIDWAQATPGIEKINLRALSSNQRALGLYRKFGFEEEGRRIREVRYADGSYADDVFMARFIRKP